MKKATGLIRQDDLEDLKAAVLFANTATQTDVTDSNLIQIREFQDNGVVLRIPTRKCNVGHLLVLYIFLNKAHVKMNRLPSRQELEPGTISVTAKVRAIQPVPDSPNEVFVELEFYQIVEKEWNGLLKTYADLQERLSDLFKKMKGAG